MKSFLLSFLSLALIFAIVSSNTVYLNTPYKKQYDSSKITLNESNLMDFISHGLNLLDSAPEDQNSKDLIENFGFSSVFEPILMNYLFLVERKDSLVNQNIEGTKLNLNVCESKDCLLTRIFSEKNENSIASKLKETYPEEKLSFLYSTYPTNLYESSALHLSLDNNKFVSFVGNSEEGKIYSSGETIDSCVNNFLKGSFEFDFSSNKVYKYRTDSTVTITPENELYIQDFMKDICTLSQFSRMIRNDGRPNIFAFYIQSIAQLENKLPNEEMKVVEEIWNTARNKFVNLVKKKYSKEEIIGQNIYITPKIETIYHDLLVDNKPKNRVLVEETPVVVVSQMWSNTAHYQAYVWLPVVLIFVLFFSVMALVNLDFSKDTLLYAKFITSDAH